MFNKNLLETKYVYLFAIVSYWLQDCSQGFETNSNIQ